jgi:hypothetical protein
MFDNFGFMFSIIDGKTSMFILLLILHAIGDIFSYKTKAMLSTIFITGMILLIGFWFGLPKTIFHDTKLIDVSLVVFPFIVVYMGSLIKLKKLKEEWKTVFVAVSSLIGIMLGLLGVARFFIGYDMALMAGAPIAGHIVATVIVSEAARSAGLINLVVFATLLLVLQNFVGLPIASYCLKKEVNNILKLNHIDDVELNMIDTKNEEVAFRIFPKTPKALQTPLILMAKTAVIVWLALFVSQYYNMWIVNLGLHYIQIPKFIFCLIFGVIFFELGFLEYGILEKANAMGYTIFFCFIVIFNNLVEATPELISTLIYPIFISFTCAVLGIIFVTYFTSKLVNYRWTFGIALGMTCLFGFPGTLIITDEVTTACCKTDKEKKYCMNVLLPKMLIAGFSAVTICSAILAGGLAVLIQNLS